MPVENVPLRSIVRSRRYSVRVLIGNAKRTNVAGCGALFWNETHARIDVPSRRAARSRPDLMLPGCTAITVERVGRELELTIRTGVGVAAGYGAGASRSDVVVGHAEVVERAAAVAAQPLQDRVASLPGAPGCGLGVLVVSVAPTWPALRAQVTVQRAGRSNPAAR